MNRQQQKIEQANQRLKKMADAGLKPREEKKKLQQYLKRNNRDCYDFIQSMLGEFPGMTVERLRDDHVYFDGNKLNQVNNEQ